MKANDYMSCDLEYPKLSKWLSIQKVSDEKLTVFVETTKKSYVIGTNEYKLMLEMDGSKDVNKLSNISKVYNEQQMLNLIKVFQKIGFVVNDTEKESKSLIVRTGLIRFKIRIISGNRLFRSESWLVKLLSFIILYLSLPVFIYGLVRFYLVTDYFSELSIDAFARTPIYAYLLLFFMIVAVHELGHAIVTRNLHIPVSEIGLMFYIIYPLVYTDISFSRLLTRRFDRLKCLFGGILTNLFFAGISLCLCRIDFSSLFYCILFSNIALNILIIATNLVIFFKLDGYYILQDILEIPYLYEKSMRYVSELIWKPIKKHIAHRDNVGRLQISSLSKGVKYTEDSEYKNSELYKLYGMLCISYIPLMILSIVFLFVS